MLMTRDSLKERRDKWEPTTVIIKGVPALVCDNCAEHYLDPSTARTTESLAAGAVKDGREVALLHFVAALRNVAVRPCRRDPMG